MFQTLWKRLLVLVRRDRFDRELDEEMRFHLEMKAQENREAGMSRNDARHTALRGFGNPTLLQEVSREMWGLRWLEELFQDLQYGFRMLRHSPGFTATAVLSLALGIGANTAIFTVIDTVLLRMLPVKDPGELVQIMNVSPKDRRPNAAFSYPAFERLRDRQLVRGMFASAGLRLNVTADGQAELARGQLVSGSFFTVLGVQPVIGRTFTTDDDRVPGGHPVAVISHGYWKRRFALNPAVVGKGVALNAKPFAIIGVTPPDFFGIQVGDATDFWVPMMMQGEFDVPALNNPGYWWLEVVARLDPAVPREQSQAGLNLAYRHALAEMRDGDPTRARERPEDQRRIELDTGSQTPASLEIVGVVKDTKYNSVREETPPMVYVPYLQSPMPLGDLKLHARTVGDPTVLVSAVRREIQAVDRNLAVYDIRTLEQQVDQSLFAERLFVTLSSSFGFLALLLASIGLYGVMSYTVTRRTGEIGVRMALGAGRGSVLRLLLWDTLVLVLIGAALGVPAALAAGRVISSQMYGLTPGDPATISAATVVMAAVALLAGYLPARRASRVDPLVALRHD